MSGCINIANFLYERFISSLKEKQKQWRIINYYGLGPGEPRGPMQPQWVKWGPSGYRAKTLARASDMLQCRFLISESCKISPQSPGNGISETLDSKIFRVSMPWTPRKLVHIRRSTRAFATSTGEPSKSLNRGPPDITLRH